MGRKPYPNPKRLRSELVQIRTTTDTRLLFDALVEAMGLELHTNITKGQVFEMLVGDAAKAHSVVIDTVCDGQQ